MPGIGHTVTRGPAEFKRMDLAEFRRVYLARWPEEMPAAKHSSRRIDLAVCAIMAHSVAAVRETLADRPDLLA